MNATVSRREFLRRCSLYGGSIWLALNATWPRTLTAADASRKPLVLDATDWKTVEAITARIIPSDADPGAVEAGCVNFIDKALANEDEGLKPTYEQGLVGLAAVCSQAHGTPFVELSADEQDAVLVMLQDDAAGGWPAGATSAPEFFEAVRVHTIIGFLADPKYGGNRDHVGWKLVGYPGPSHMRGGYTPEQMLGTEEVTAIWGEKL